MKKLIVCIALVLLPLSLYACNQDTRPNADTDIEETTSQEILTDEEIVTQSFEDIYHKAERIYSLFTRYGKLTYTENEKA